MRRKYLSPISLFAVAGWSFLATDGYSQSTQNTEEPLKTVVRVSLDAATGTISVGSNQYQGANPGVNIVALKRQPDSSHLDTPDLVGNGTFTDATSANAFLQNILNGPDPDALLILNAVGNYNFGLNQIAANLEQFGSASDIEGVSGAIQFVFVGIGGLNVKGAHQSGYSNQNMSGYLAADSNQHYTFIQTDYVKYDLLVDGSGAGQDGTINIGTNSYTVAGSGKLASCTGSNGFHLVAVQREVPGTLITNESYCTAQADSEITHLITDLSNLVGSESNLVFIASFGHPIPSNWNFGTDGDARISPLASLIAELGGYWETMVYLTPSDTFSLVGATAPPAGTPGAWKRGREASSVYPGHPTGEMHGVLARGLRGNWYSPMNADYSGVANLGLYGVLAIPPTSFPHPANGAELTAFEYIASQLCPSCQNYNPRNDYPNTNVAMSAYISKLQGMTDPNGGGACPQSSTQTTPFCIMRQQLQTEFALVSDIRDLNQNLNTVWTASGTTSIFDMLSISTTIENSVSANASSPAPSLVDPLVNFFLSLGSLLPDIGPVFGLADTGFNLGTSLTTDPSGNPTNTLTTTVGNLQTQASNSFIAQAGTLGTQFDLIYQDWGKINALGTDLADASPGSTWYWNGDTTTGQILNAMNPAIQQSYYRNMMAATYAIGSYVPICYLCPGPVNWGGTPLWQQPQNYTVNDPDLNTCWGCTDKAQPFNFPWYVPYTFPTDSTNPYSALGNGTNTILAGGDWLGISNINAPQDSGSNGLYQPPVSTVLGYLFAPLAPNKDGVGLASLGVYIPAFFEGWPFPRVVCGYSDDGSGDPGPGCNWAAATQPPTILPGLSIGLSIQAGGVATSGTQLGIPLTITNNSNVATTSIQIKHLSVRTVPGSDEIKIESPSLPREIGVLAPGATTTITVHLNVPSTVKKLMLTENGVVGIGDLVPYKFSLGQVVFPNKTR
jgi:hypothetical protein